MSISKRLNIKNYTLKLLREQDESFFYLAPEIVGSVTNANLNFKRNTFDVDFNTIDGRDMKLVVPHKCLQNWEQNNDSKESNIKDFIISFLTVSNPIEDGDEMLDEIVDEFGTLMPDDDMPSNANFRPVGKSKFDTEKVIKQTIPKSKRYYGDLGLGVVVWE